MKQETPSAVSREMPASERIATAYDHLHALADEHLDRPVSTHLKTWEDGTFEVRVWHHYSLPSEDGHRRDLLRYHSREDAVELATVRRQPADPDTTIITCETLQAGGVTDAKKR